ncbi:receptor protein kinase-like protein [Thioploca ingrica]|uniref:Receptor protein kinase-like protein n=1 Tax=Thioploca ingrica TaxID=40754 RepID=A0A090AGN9_9GAMM|nr:receptor protein kinase-like protein [Thioploca ingrica]
MKNLRQDKFVQRINCLQLLPLIGILTWSSWAQAATDCATVTEISPTECGALVALYKSTTGPNWYDNQTNNWNVTNTPCSWTGVTCDGISPPPQHVIGITRREKRLVGTLPDLSALTSLQTLDLVGYDGWCWDCKNQLGGTLPNLSALTSLKSLDLSYNLFTGNIDPLSLPTSLTSLYLEGNQLEGIISSLPGSPSLTNLTSLYLQNNQLKGAIPDFSSFASLEYLDLSYNYYLTGPLSASLFPINSKLKSLTLYSTGLNQPLPDLSTLTQLTSLNLSSTRLTGPVKAEFFPAISLTSLDLSSNYSLNQPLPDLSTLTKLTTLNLAYSSLTGPINPALFPLSLNSLYLSSTQLSGQIPNFSNLVNLTNLDLSYNYQLTGPIDGSLFPIPTGLQTGLQTLSLYGTPLNQTLPDLSILDNLANLGLSSTQLTGPIDPSYLPTNLGSLSLDNNQLNSSLPDLSGLKSLGYLNISNNQLSDAINGSYLPPNLVSLFLDNNQLTGPFPNLSGLTQLSELSISSNQLSDFINGSSLRPSLNRLSLYNNQLSGAFPNLGGVTNLGYLDISNNQLSGPIEASSLPPNLGEFSLSNNQFNGVIPNLPSGLWRLNLSWNHFTGAIPNLPAGIGALYLNNNQLSGEIPDSLTNLTGLCSQSPDIPCWEYSDLGYNHLKVPASTQVTAFLEAPGNKDPDWASTQTVFLLTCPNGGSLGIQSAGYDPDTGEFDFGTKIVNSTASLNINIVARDCGTLQVDSIGFLGTDASEFHYNADSKSCSTGDRYSACQFTVAFTPLTLGTKEATLKFILTDPSINKELIIQAKAIRAGNAKIDVVPNSYDFGEVNIGESSAIQEFKLENTGNIDLKWDFIGLTEDRANYFFYPWNCAYKNVLYPAKACDFGAQFIPVIEGEKKASILISSSDTPSKKVTLRGTAKTPEECLNENITIESKRNGNWDNASTWSGDAIPTPADNVRIKRGHTITALPYTAVKALCIENGGGLKSSDNKGTYLILHAENYLQNKGSIKGQDGVSETGYSCTGDYWSVIGKPECAQPGASVILSVGDGSKNLFRNEGVITAGNGGKGKQYGAYGGGVSVYGGSFINTATLKGSGGIIIAGKGGDITDSQPGRAGKGGDLSLMAENYLHHHGEVQIAAGGGGNCNAASGQVGGNGGNLRLAAPLLVKLGGGDFSTGQGGINCSQNGLPGNVFIEPSVISLAGASTKIEGGNVTIFGGKDWVLDLSNVGATVIKATGNITLAVGEGGIINLKNNRGFILEAGGRVNLFSDNILLDDGVGLSDLIKAASINEGPSKILYDVSLIGSGKHTGEPGTTLPISLTLVNGGPETDTYTLQLVDPKGWVSGQITSPLEVKALDTHELSLEVALPNEPGEINTITITAISQTDATVKAVAEIQVAVAQATIHAVTLTTETNQWFGEPGSTLSIPLTLTNKGNEIDTYTLKTSNSANWALELLPASVPLDKSASANLNLNMTLPAEPGAKSVITITATSQADPSVIEEMLLTVGTTSHDFSLTTTSPQVSGEPGAILPIELELTNNGSNADTYELKVTDNPANLTVNGLPTTPLPVEISETKKVVLEIILPTEPGATNTLAVTATSQNDPNVTKVLPMTITVAGKNTDNNSQPIEITPTPPPVTVPIVNQEISTPAVAKADEPAVPPPPVVPSPEVTQTTVISDISGLTSCPPTGEIDYLCRNHGHTLTNAALGTDAKVAGGQLAGVIENKGIVSQVTIQPDTLLKGGRLTGYIVNEGTLADFTFVGAQVSGGTLAGIVTNDSRVGGTLINVHLAANTHITGGNLQGEITGEAAAPALLEELTVKANSHLSQVKIGKNVQFEDQVTFGDGVQFVNPAEDPRQVDLTATDSKHMTISQNTEIITTCNTELPQLGVIATNSQGKTVVTSAQIAGGAAATSGTFQRELTVSLSKPVDIRATLCVDPKQVGQLVGFIAYAAYTAADSPNRKSALYRLDANNQVLPWDGNFASLLAFKEDILEPTQTVEIYQGKLVAPPGVIEIHFGYRLEDGTVTVSDKTIQITITN